MDGTNPGTFVSGVGRVHGLVVDFESSRLYWAEKFAKKIQSCSLDGGEVLTVAEVSSQPLGIAFVDQMLFWSLEEEGKVESMEKGGGEVRSVYNGTHQDFHHLTSPDVVLRRNRKNPCGRQACKGVCVLNSTFHLLHVS